MRVFAARRGPVMTDWLPRLLRLLGIVALVVQVHAPALAETAACLDCHADKGPAIEFPQGGRIEAFVDERKFKDSVHGLLACTDCHDQSLTGKGHEQQRFRSEGLFKLRYSAHLQALPPGRINSLPSRCMRACSSGKPRAALRCVRTVTRPTRSCRSAEAGSCLARPASCARCHPAQGEAVAPGEARSGTDVPDGFTVA